MRFKLSRNKKIRKLRIFLLFDFYVDFPSMEKLNFKSGQDGRRKGVFQRADLFDKNVA